MSIEAALVQKARVALVACANGIEHLSALARLWEPDHSTGSDRLGWVLANDAKDNARATIAAIDAALAAPAEPVYPEAAEVCAEAYQVVGSLLSDLGQFDTERADKILDNLSQHRKVHDDVLPWPSFGDAALIRQGREALDLIVRRLQMDIDDGGRPDQWSMEDLVRKATSAIAALDAAMTPSERP